MLAALSYHAAGCKMTPNLPRETVCALERQVHIFQNHQTECKKNGYFIYVKFHSL